jgi:exosortase
MSGAAPQIVAQGATTVRTTNTVIAVQAVCIGGLLFHLYGGVLAYMASDWWNYEAHSQGMLLPPLALYIAWLQKERIFSHPAVPDRRGLLLTCAGCLTYLFGSLASEFFMTRISFVIVLTGIIWSYWGYARVRVLTLPLLLLATMVPLPALVYNSVAAPLQLLASDIAAQLAQAVGVSVYRDGNILQLANITLGVAEACSGLNSLSALVVGGILVGYTVCSRPLGRVLVVLSAVPIAIGVNMLRVAGTAVLADYNEAFAVGFYHYFSGWAVFVAGCGALYACAWILHKVLDRKAL